VGRLRGRHRFWTFASIAAVAIIAGAVGSAVASQLASGVDTYTGCLTTSGDLSKFAKGTTPAKACTGSQVQVSFSGPLPSGCADGDLLTWQGGWGCGSGAAGRGGDVFVIRRLDEPIVSTPSYSEVLRLPLQPGLYEITGKLGLHNRSPSSPFNLQCALVPSNQDGSPGSPGSADADVGFLNLAPAGSPGDQGGVSLAVSEDLAQPGSVVLSCAGYGNAYGAFTNYVAIRATRVNSITRVSPAPLP
jgi:hypothetical protein